MGLSLLRGRLCQWGWGVKHKGFWVSCCQCGDSGTAWGQEPGGCQPTVILPSQDSSALVGAWWPQPRDEGRLCLNSRAQQCQMTLAFHYRSLTMLVIAAK